MRQVKPWKERSEWCSKSMAICVRLQGLGPEKEREKALSPKP
jgi:hypothetical protein